MNWKNAVTAGMTIGLCACGNGNDQAETPAPTAQPEEKSDWVLVWSDEFNEPAGTPPDPENWSYELGDGTEYGNPGWGNKELQYYTDDPANAATDGEGNLAITVREADGSLECYYGPCKYTSARLTSHGKAEFEYGRIEGRILLPEGSGVWSAFWSLGTDFKEAGWPLTGEIDFMEYVGRLPNVVYGTIHGPGHSGGESFGANYEFEQPPVTDFHVYSVEWAPDLIEWYIDGNLYHTATPADVDPDWVYNDPVFLLLNVAMGGYFGGDVDPELSLPVAMVVDYIRVYQQPEEK